MASERKIKTAKQPQREVDERHAHFTNRTKFERRPPPTEEMAETRLMDQRRHDIGKVEWNLSRALASRVPSDGRRPFTISGSVYRRLAKAAHHISDPCI
jgi:hypothetical protein